MKFVCTLEDGKLAGGDAVCSVCTFFSFHFKWKGWEMGYFDKLSNHRI